MRRLLLSLITLLPFAGYAQQPIELSLEDAFNYAVKNNYTVKNARLDVLIQEAKNAEITGLAYPQVKGQGQYTDYINPIQSFIPGEFFGKPGTFQPIVFTPKYSSTASVSGSQILFDGTVMVALQARRAIMQLVEENAQLSAEDVKYNVQKAYFSYVVAQKQYDILKSSLANARVLLHDITVLHDNGLAEKIDVDRTTVQVNNLRTDSIRTDNLLSVSEQLLKYRMGMDVEQPILLTDTVLKDNLTEAQTLLLNELNYNNRTDYNLLQSQLTLNQYDLKRHRLSGLPALAAFGNANYTYSSNTFSDLLHNKYVFYSLWGLQLNVPIFDGMQRRKRVTQAELNVEKSQNNIDNLKLGIDFQVKQSRISLKNAIASAQSQQENVVLGNTVLDLAQRKYKEGVGSNLEVTQAQNDLLQAQNNYFLSVLDVINNQADLQKALGDFK